MRFIRNMPWLRTVFPATEMPMEGPSVISDDVQYVSDFFGAGYGLREPQSWFSSAVISKAADDSLVTIDTMPIGETVRILGAGLGRNAGNQAIALTGCLCIVAPDATVVVPLGDPSGTILPIGASGNYRGHFYLWMSRMVPGGATLRMYFGLGDNTAYTVSFLAVSVPRGVAIGA